MALRHFARQKAQGFNVVGEGCLGHRVSNHAAGRAVQRPSGSFPPR
jgi:hypothetical protein